MFIGMRQKATSDLTLIFLCNMPLYVRLLILGASSKMFHLNELANALTILNVECKIIPDMDVYSKYPIKKLWYVETLFNYYGLIPNPMKFQKQLDDFKPDVVLTDSQSYAGLMTIRAKRKLIMHLRGDYWSEIRWARETLYRSPQRRLALWWKCKIAEKVFSQATAILPICNYLADIVKERYPNNKIRVLHSGITPTRWYPVPQMNLKHPCVGLLQGAHIWGKAREMLILKDVMKSMPEVTFYWAGDGPYTSKILPELSKHENFQWLGALQYPDKVRQFLSSIDVYALVTGMDMSPLTLQEASLMGKPVVATRVGGIPELMMEGETGFLVEKGDADGLKNALSILLSDSTRAKHMGSLARKYTGENFSWDVMARKFLDSINM